MLRAMEMHMKVHCVRERIQLSVILCAPRFQEQHKNDVQPNTFPKGRFTVRKLATTKRFGGKGREVNCLQRIWAFSKGSELHKGVFIYVVSSSLENDKQTFSFIL